MWKDPNYQSPFSSYSDAVKKLSQSKVTGSITIFLNPKDEQVFKKLYPSMKQLNFRVVMTGILEDGRQEITILTTSTSEAIQCDKWSRLLNLLQSNLD